MLGAHKGQGGKGSPETVAGGRLGRHESCDEVVPMPACHWPHRTCGGWELSSGTRRKGAAHSQGLQGVRRCCFLCLGGVCPPSLSRGMGVSLRALRGFGSRPSRSLAMRLQAKWLLP